MNSAAAEEFSFNGATEGIFFESRKSVIRLVELLIERAHEKRASDVHIDPRSDHVLVRYRIDGMLLDAYTVPTQIHAEIISRIKILSGLRIDEHYGAQDGRFRLQLSEQAIDVRVSVLPTFYGENAVLRLLAKAAGDQSLDALGFTRENQEKINRALGKPYGMIVATGPTGSGKTTTLYSLIKALDQPGVSIVTLEDPIEYSIDGIRQVQIQSKSALTFSAGLRSLLRQDPNVIMVGEIRDQETAGLAVNAALTGHLVLTTLHTNDAPTTIVRLLDMGVEPYLIASTLVISIGQRLVRRICEKCALEQRMSKAERESIARSLGKPLPDSAAFYRGCGCGQCGNSGYRGRTGIHEVMEISATVREAILRKASVDEIRAAAISSGMAPIINDGLRKAAKGLTSVEEVLRMRYE